jgi:hypothetical protein
MIVSFPIFLLAVLVFQRRTRATTYLVIVLSGISSLAGRPCPACCDALAVAVLDLAISLIALTGGTGLGNALDTKPVDRKQTAPQHAVAGKVRQRRFCHRGDEQRRKDWRLAPRARRGPVLGSRPCPARRNSKASNFSAVDALKCRDDLSAQGSTLPVAAHRPYETLYQ